MRKNVKNVFKLLILATLIEYKLTVNCLGDESSNSENKNTIHSLDSLKPKDLPPKDLPNDEITDRLKDTKRFQTIEKKMSEDKAKEEREKNSLATEAENNNRKKRESLYQGQGY